VLHAEAKAVGPGADNSADNGSHNRNPKEMVASPEDVHAMRARIEQAGAEVARWKKKKTKKEAKGDEEDGDNCEVVVDSVFKILSLFYLG
jgi:hypothetical protein